MKNKKMFFTPFTNFLHTLVSCLKIVLKSKLKIKLPASISDTCIVLGNGPSLKQSLSKFPSFFKKHPLVCVNSFAITDEYALLQPDYYVMLDPSWWLGENEVLLKTVDAIASKTTWLIYLLLPQESRGASKLLELQNTNLNVSIIFFNYTVFNGFEKIANWFYKNNLAMPQSQNVLVSSLFLPINMGYKRIYLFGADHTWHETLYVNDDNVLCLKHIHFYEKESEIKLVPFYKGVHIKDTFTMSEIMYTFGKVFKGYEQLNKYANSTKVRIFNASEISFIDAFERIKIKDE